MGQPFETVADAHRLAKRRLPKVVYRALIAGSEAGVTPQENRRAFNEIGLIPRIFDRPEVRDQRTRVLGLDLPLPVIASPVGAQAIYPHGEVAVARAVASVGTAMGLSSFASQPIEAVMAVNPNTLFQVYWAGTRDEIEGRVERARRAGATGLIVTLDWSFAHRRDWGSAPIPQRIDLPTMIRYAPMAMSRPVWTASFALSLKLPDLTVPNFQKPGQPAPTFFEAYGEWMQTPLPTQADLEWLRSIWTGPFVIKGIMDPDEARRAVDIGATAVSVSNHGGNNIDGIPASLRVLPAVVEAVGDQVEILFDGGIRRGSDVVKALALGADAVMIGRAHLWGLAAAGETGVRHVFEILRAGIDETMLGLGRGSLAELTPDDLVLPRDFEIRPRARAPRTVEKEPAAASA